MNVPQERLLSWQDIIDIHPDHVRMCFGDSEIKLSKDGAILFTNSNTQLALCADGTLNINAKNIEQRASHQVKIQGGHSIHLNSEGE